MRDQLAAHDFVYVHTDIPAGITIRAWRAKRAAECAARRQQERQGGWARRWWRRGSSPAGWLRRYANWPVSSPSRSLSATADTLVPPGRRLT
jgi:hypothetical protein